MTTTTTHLGLTTYSPTTDASALFLDYRTDVAGISAISNMGILDAFATDTSASIVSLNAKGFVTPVDATYSSPNTFVATVASITSYDTNMVINLTLDTTSDGTVTLNISSLGAKTLQKTDSDGGPINLTNHDLQKNKNYLFRYNGSAFVWIAPTSADQISISGSSHEIIVLSGSGLATSGSFLEDLAPSTANYVVSAMNDNLSGEILLTAGSGIEIDNNVSASTIIINNNIISGSGTTIEIDISASTLKVNTNLVSGSGTLLEIDISASSLAIHSDFAGSDQVTSGSSVIRVVSPNGLSQSNYGWSVVEVALNGSTALEGTEEGYIRIPSKIDGFSFMEIAASSGSSTSGSPQFTVYSGSTSLLSTVLTIDQGETDSSTASASAVIDPDWKIVNTGDRIKVASSGSETCGTDVTYSVIELTFGLEV